ncbi:MAG: hypothetical protein CMJ75_02725 [Planctomycetaceae bacterium]|nr:hypothetical protein [Planctomycetaceae bacterium]
MNRLLLLIDTPGAGDWNMAVDEWLLQTAGDRTSPVLRFYRWAEPTLSLGYFQHHADRNQHAGSLNCPFVRRASGGGAILHDKELTYSLTLPINDRFSSMALDHYYDLHRSLIETLGEWSITATLVDPGQRDNTAFLCFQRRSPGDVVIADTKIAGSAQRRSAGSILQHGSVLLRSSKAAPELPGIQQATDCSIDIDDLMCCWRARLLSRWNMTAHDLEINGHDIAAIKHLVDQRFAIDTWNKRR